MTGSEQGLREIALETRMEVVIIRQPLVYEPGVNANFAAMIRGLRLDVPLPLGAIHNQRSLVALDNLVDLDSSAVAGGGVAAGSGGQLSHGLPHCARNDERGCLKRLDLPC